MLHERISSSSGLEFIHAPTTPGGTPLFHAVAGAVAETMLEQGIYVRQVLALMPVNWQYLNAISVQIAPLTPAQAFHPNILDYEDADAGDMGHGADEGEEHETEEADPNREDRNPAEEVNRHRCQRRLRRI